MSQVQNQSTNSRPSTPNPAMTMANRGTGVFLRHQKFQPLLGTTESLFIAIFDDGHEEHYLSNTAHIRAVKDRSGVIYYPYADAATAKRTLASLFPVNDPRFPERERGFDVLKSHLPDLTLLQTLSPEEALEAAAEYRRDRDQRDTRRVTNTRERATTASPSATTAIMAMDDDMPID